MVVATLLAKLWFLGIIVFILYLILFCWLVARLPFFNKSGLGWPLLILLFICKIAAGFAYARFYAMPQYLAGSDTWRFFEASKLETDWLLTNPLAFVKDIFHHGYANSGNIFYGQNSYWNDLKSNVVIKLLAVCNVFTFKNYYADLVFFNFLFFFGPVAFYRVMADVFTGKKWAIVVTVFLLPSCLFWCSGIHKDGLIFTCLALLIFYSYKQLVATKTSLFCIMACFFCLLALFAMRNVICLLLVPALLVLWLCYKYPSKRILTITMVYGLCVALFFVSPYIYQGVNLPQYAVEKQNEFKLLQGGSQIHLRPLQPTFVSFMQFLPSALDVALLRPHIAEIKNVSYVPAVGELFLLWFLAGLYFINEKKPVEGNAQTAVVIFCFAFALSYLLLSGYTVTFSGAIVRYKSIILPLIFCPLTCMANIGKKIVISNKL